MTILKSLNLTLRFLLELCLLAAFSYVGYMLSLPPVLKLSFAIVLPAFVALIWGLFIAPKAVYALRRPNRILLEMVLFGSAVGLLVMFGRLDLAIALGFAVAVNETLLIVWKQ